MSENWETDIRQTTSIYYSSRNRGEHRGQQQSDFKSNSWRDRTTIARPTAGRNDHRNRLSPGGNIGYSHAYDIRKPYYNNGHQQRYGKNNSDNQDDHNFSIFPSWRRNSRQQSSYQHDRRQNLPYTNMRPVADSRQAQPSDRRPYYRPCYNCGETNHSHSECRYQQRVRCNNCSAYGHKTRLCNKGSI